MKKSKSDDYKVYWGFQKDVQEILVSVVLSLCLGGAGYAFFKYQEKEDCTQIIKKASMPNMSSYN